MWGVRTVTLAGLVVFALAGCGGSAIDYSDEKGAFRIRLPAQASTESDLDLPRGVHAVRVVERAGSYVVAWEDLDLTQAKLTPDERLEAACTAAVTRLKGKELSRKAITLGGKHPGRELVLQTKDGNTVVHDRMYLVGPRLYSVVAQGEKWWVERGAARTVMDSFRVVEE